MHCSIFSPEKHFPLLLRATTIFYHSHLVGIRSNSLSRPIHFELPPPAELFFLWHSDAPVGLEVRKEKQIQLARSAVRGENTLLAWTAQGWLQLPSLQTVFSTSGTGSVWAGIKTSFVTANESLAWLWKKDVNCTCLEKSSFPHTSHSFLLLSAFKHTTTGPVWEGGCLCISLLVLLH